MVSLIYYSETFKLKKAFTCTNFLNDADKANCSTIFPLSFQSHAQDKTSLYFMIGGGPTREFGSAFSNGNFSQSDPIKLRQALKIGFTFGFEFNYRISDRFAIKSRLLSEGKGVSYYQDSYNYSFGVGYTYQNSVKTDESIRYVTLSIIPQYLFKKFNAGIGPYFGVPYKAMDKNQFINYSPPILTSYNNIEGLVQSPDVGLVLNVGYTIPVKEFVFTFQLSDSYGVKSMFPSKTVLGTPLPASYSNNYLFLIGITKPNLRDAS